MIRFEPKDSTQEVKVSFVLDDAGLDGDVSVVGDFNDWDPMATPLRKQKGQRMASVTAIAGRRYAFRYLGADDRWFNDPEADAYQANEFGGQDGVVDLTAMRPSEV